jgi:tetratricopeptide (TPR) repeat protein
MCIRDRANFYRFKQDANAVSGDIIKALGLNPNDVSVQFTAVHLLFEVQRCQHALAIINSTIAGNPKNDEAFEWRFRVKTCLGDVVGALDDINTAVALNPQSSVHRANQAILLKKLGESDKAARNFDQLIASLEQKLKSTTEKEELEKLKRELSMTYIERSRTFANNQNYEAMFADLNRAVEVNPAYYVYQLRSRAYKWQKMFAEAVADLTKAIELSDNDSGLLMDRGDIYFLMQEYSEAVADYVQVVKLKSGLEQIAEKRISQAKQKMQENANQPK